MRLGRRSSVPIATAAATGVAASGAAAGSSPSFSREPGGALSALPGSDVSKHSYPLSTSNPWPKASTLGYALCGSAVIAEQEMEFPRPMHTDSELQLNISRAAGARHKRHTARQILLQVNSRRLRQEEIVG